MGEKMHFSELDQYLFGQGTHYGKNKRKNAPGNTMIFIKNLVRIPQRREEKKEFILRCGRQMLSLFL